MITNNIHKIVLALAVIISMAACSSDDNDTVDEWGNWQEKNDTYWSNLYASAQRNIAAGDSTWKIIPNWAITNQQSATTGATLTYDPTDYIIVHVENVGKGSTSPMYTDSVSIHYLGRLIPSTTYTSGLIFDASYNYTDGYNLATMRPYVAQANAFITGFTTALLNMHEGDRWTVYIPYNMAYGSSSPGNSSANYGSYTYSSSSSSSSIQPYSNLIFDITLVDFYAHGEKVPTIQ